MFAIGRWQSSSAKVLLTSDRVSAQMKQHMQPDAYSEIWSLLLSESAEIVSSKAFPDLQKLEQPFFFGGAGTMKTASFEPDACGSIRLFVSGKVRIQLFSAVSLKSVVPLIKGKDFSTSCENFFRRSFADKDYARMPSSFKAIIDCSTGPKTLVVPPGWWLVQEALDAAISCGIRRSFSSKSGAIDFDLACSDTFKFKEQLLIAMRG